MKGESVLQTTQMGELWFLSEEGKKLTDYSRQSALTDCKNKMAIYLVFRMLSHLCLAQEDGLISSIPGCDWQVLIVFTVKYCLLYQFVHNHSDLTNKKNEQSKWTKSQAQTLFQINKRGSHKFKKLFPPLKTKNKMSHSEKFSETLNEIIYLPVGFVKQKKKKENSCSKHSKYCCNSQCVLEIIMSYTYYNSTQLTQNLKMERYFNYAL